MVFFYLFFVTVTLQRICELIIAKQNEKWMKKQGAVEFGQAHYRAMVLIHFLFFLSFLSEVIFLKKVISPFWVVLLILFLITQVVRIWALFSLGKYWNTKILVLPETKVVKRGPYRFLKHPNYAIVTIELMIIPLLFQAYLTAIFFSILNMVILSVRIPAEEKALKELTNYDGEFENYKRFVPKMLKKCDKKC
ncbi:MAG: isoprenylcysteine carboxylmethyltransferase family protein [Bacillota bacterium]|nr:isoprenylcysteine carboxylmethyltransferase family protein [Bacillota bacterium]MDP4170879.1 isoprenylcysteine carboxylmethyltransferase family protein [Bacillota bacterium]